MAEAEGTWVYALNINFIDGKSVNILPSDIIELYFIEDIFSISITGRVRFIDIRGVIERIETFTGDLSLTMMWGKRNNKAQTVTDKQGKVFYAHSIKFINFDASRKVRIYEILFYDITYTLFNKMHFSYSWENDKKPHEIVEDFCKKLTKVIDETTYKKSSTYWENGLFCKNIERLPCYYSPFWNVRQNLQYLIPRSRSEEHDCAGYLFFTTSDAGGGYELNFVTLEKLLSNQGSTDPINEFYFHITAEAIKNQIKFDECKVMDWRILSFDNTGFDSIIGSTYCGYDFHSAKEPFKRVFSYEDGIKKTTILGEKSLFSKVETKKTGNAKEDAVDPARPVIWTMEDNDDIIENMWYDDWVKRYCQQQMIEVVTIGSQSRKIGSIATLRIPRTFAWRPDGDEGPFNDPELQRMHPRWSGKALIKSITHYFTPTEPSYIQKVTLIKNGYEAIQDGDANLVPAQKTNKGSGS